MAAGPFISGQGRKEFTPQLRQNKWEPLEILALLSSSQQMKLVDFGVLSFVGSAFLPEVLGSE